MVAHGEDCGSALFLSPDTRQPTSGRKSTTCPGRSCSGWGYLSAGGDKERKPVSKYNIPIGDFTANKHSL